MWELADLGESDGRRIDLVIATKFPSYFVHHDRRVLWLTHQYRQLYDLYGTPYSDYNPARWRDRRLRRRFVARDTAALARYARRFTISANTRERMRRYNGLEAETLYPPPKLAGRVQCLEYGDFILSVGRLNRMKRTEGLLHALALTKTAARAVIAGTGPEEGRLKQLTQDLGLAARVEFAGYVDDDRLIDLYGRCLGVFFAPLDEDYGYITLEAFLAAKPVLTCNDSGGSMEFVVHEQNGFILPPGRLGFSSVLYRPPLPRPRALPEFRRNRQDCGARHHVGPCARPAAGGSRMKIAWFSPLNPMPSGIADYSEELSAEPRPACDHRYLYRSILYAQQYRNRPLFLHQPIRSGDVQGPGL